MNIMTKLLLCSKARTSFLPSIWISIELLHMHTIRETILFSFSLSIYLRSFRTSIQRRSKSCGRRCVAAGRTTSRWSFATSSSSRAWRHRNFYPTWVYIDTRASWYWRWVIVLDAYFSRSEVFLLSGKKRLQRVGGGEGGEAARTF